MDFFLTNIKVNVIFHLNWKFPRTIFLPAEQAVFDNIFDQNDCLRGTRKAQFNEWDRKLLSIWNPDGINEFSIYGVLENVERGPPLYIEIQIIQGRGIPLAVNSNYFVIKKNRSPARRQLQRRKRPTGRVLEKAGKVKEKEWGILEAFHRLSFGPLYTYLPFPPIKCL